MNSNAQAQAPKERNVDNPVRSAGHENRRCLSRGARLFRYARTLRRAKAGCAGLHPGLRSAALHLPGVIIVAALRATINNEKQTKIKTI
jgi:hypothetical protein